MVVSTKRTIGGPGSKLMPIANATHKDPFSHASLTRPISRRIGDPPSVAASSLRPCGREIAVGVLEPDTSAGLLSTAAGWYARRCAQARTVISAATNSANIPTPS